VESNVQRYCLNVRADTHRTTAFPQRHQSSHEGTQNRHQAACDCSAARRVLGVRAADVGDYEPRRDNARKPTIMIRFDSLGRSSQTSGIYALLKAITLFGASSATLACGSSESDSGNGTGGSLGSSAGSASGGAAGLAGSQTTGGSAGASSASCPQPSPPVLVPGTGGEDGPAVFCFPGIVCFGPDVATPGLPFVRAAHFFLGSSPDGEPLTVGNEGEKPTAKVTNPAPGKVCMSGDDGARLSLSLLTGEALEDGSSPPPLNLDRLFPAASLGIKAVRFTIETPPSSAILPGVITFGPACDDVGGGDAARDGTRVVITSNGTRTLSLETDFVPAFDTNAISALAFTSGPGAYDYCITDLQCLDAAGNEVLPESD
jgi:hypothetical protein